MSHSLSTLINRLRGSLSEGVLLSDITELMAYESDGLGYKRFQPDAVVIPANLAELKKVIETLVHSDVPYTVRGAGTSLSGGPVASQGGVIVHLSKLRQVEEINTLDRYAVVQSGVVLNDLNSQLESRGWYYPPDPSTGTVCTLGGNVACNAGGIHCFRYGVTGNYVLGLECLLMDGSTVTFGGPAGGRGGWHEDWKRLFVGSEGTLGVFTRFWLRIIPRPGKVWTFLATFSGLEQCSDAIAELARHPCCPAAIEFMDPRAVDLVESSPMATGLPKGSYMLLVEIDGPKKLVDRRVELVAQILRNCYADSVSYSCEDVKREALWKARKAQGGLLGQVSPDFLVQDAVIPKVHMGNILRFIYEQADENDIPVSTVIHAGDGNLHPNFLFDQRNRKEVEKVERISKRLMRKVSEVGGTLSGEHGIGNDKSRYMAAHFGATGQGMQLAVPAAFNPDSQLNPKKVFPERSFHVTAN